MPTLRSIIKGSLVTAFTFALGIGSFMLWMLYFGNPDPVSQVDDSDIFPTRISACDLYESSGKYVDKYIEVDATVWADRNGHQVGLLIYPAEQFCVSSSVDPFILTSLDLENYPVHNTGIKDILESTPWSKEIDLRIIGTVKWLPQLEKPLVYRIVPDSIEVISAPRKFEPRAFD
jgi:hypothetical protein